MDSPLWQALKTGSNLTLDIWSLSVKNEFDMYVISCQLIKTSNINTQTNELKEGYKFEFKYAAIVKNSIF